MSGRFIEDVIPDALLALQLDTGAAMLALEVRCRGRWLTSAAEPVRGTRSRPLAARSGCASWAAAPANISCGFSIQADERGRVSQRVPVRPFVRQPYHLVVQGREQAGTLRPVVARVRLASLLPAYSQSVCARDQMHSASEQSRRVCGATRVDARSGGFW